MAALRTRPDLLPVRSFCLHLQCKDSNNLILNSEGDFSQAEPLCFCVAAGERLPPQCRQRRLHQDVSDAQRERRGDRRHPRFLSRRTLRPAGPPEIWILPLKGWRLLEKTRCRWNKEKYEHIHFLIIFMTRIDNKRRAETKELSFFLCHTACCDVSTHWQIHLPVRIHLLSAGVFSFQTHWRLDFCSRAKTHHCPMCIYTVNEEKKKKMMMKKKKNRGGISLYLIMKLVPSHLGHYKMFNSTWIPAQIIKMSRCKTVDSRVSALDFSK